MRATLPQLPPFNWQVEYAPHWEGRNDGCLNDILFRPGPEDVLIIDGIRAPFRDHIARAMPPVSQAATLRICNDCTRVALPGWRYCRPCYTARRNAPVCKCNNSVFDYMCDIHG